MKNKTIILIALMLAAILLLAACGESAAPGQPGKAEDPAAEKTADVIEVPEEFVGTWISAEKKDDFFEIHADGSAYYKGTPISFANVQTFDGKIGEDIISFTCDDLSIHLGLDKQSGLIRRYGDYGAETDGQGYPVYRYYYNSGTKNPASGFFGDWTNCSESAPVWNGNPVENFSITEDGLVINNTVHPVYYVPGDAMISLDNFFMIDFRKDFDGVYIGIGNGNGAYEWGFNRYAVVSLNWTRRG